MKLLKVETGETKIRSEQYVFTTDGDRMGSGWISGRGLLSLIQIGSVKSVVKLVGAVPIHY